jgi:hypothetical protein
MAAISGDELRELQAPLKERYRDEPYSALITLQTLAGSPELSVSMLRS